MRFLILPALVVAFILGGRLLIADPATLIVARHECKKCGPRCECTTDDHCGCRTPIAREGETPGGEE